jgi:hypothetical protein
MKTDYTRAFLSLSSLLLLVLVTVTFYPPYSSKVKDKVVNQKIKMFDDNIHRPTFMIKEKVMVSASVGISRPMYIFENVKKIKIVKPKPKPPQSIIIQPAAIDFHEERNIVSPEKPPSLKNLFSRTVSGNGGRVVLDNRTAKMFIELEKKWGETLHIRWAYRDRKLNRKVGGKDKSYHLLKMALDIRHDGWAKAKMRRFIKVAYSVGFRGFGLGRNVVHIDSRKSFTSWNYGSNPYGLAYSMVK